MIGIYKITNPKGKIYIGQSINIEKRIKHYYNLTCKAQPILFNSLKKYGIRNHKLEILEECVESDLNKRERYYQEFFDSVENGLNCRYTETLEKSGKLSVETKEKMSKAQKKRFENKEHHSKGAKRSKESKKKMSEKAKGRVFSDEHIRNLSESHKGKMTGQDHPFSKTILHLDYGIYYFSIKEAAESLGVERRVLGCQLRGQNKLKYNLLLL